jgi:hypothetical protein
MKKSTLMLALGGKPEGDDSEVEDVDTESATDEDIDLALDPEADPETRREAFRRAVKGCK